MGRRNPTWAESERQDYGYGQHWPYYGWEETDRTHRKGKGKDSGKKPQVPPLAPGSFPKSVQRVVNSIRKCENRLRKLEEDRRGARGGERAALQEEAMSQLHATLAGNGDEEMPAVDGRGAEGERAWEDFMEEADRDEDVSTLLNNALLGRPGKGGDARQRLLDILAQRREARGMPPQRRPRVPADASPLQRRGGHYTHISFRVFSPYYETEYCPDVPP